MKRSSTFFLSLFIAFGAFAQLDVDVTYNGDLKNGTTHYVYGESTAGTLVGYLNSTITGPNDKTVNVKRYETSVEPNTSNFFCWGVCYNTVPVGTHPVWVSVDPIDMTAGQEYTNFSAYHQPNGSVGVSCFRYVWYDMNNSDDSTYVDICFDTETVGVEEIAMVQQLSVYPNPSKGAVDFNVALDPSVQDAELVVHNLLGEMEWSRLLNGPNSVVQLPAGLLASGVYFYSVVADGRVAVTEKLVITK